MHVAIRSSICEVPPPDCVGTVATTGVGWVIRLFARPDGIDVDLGGLLAAHRRQRQRATWTVGLAVFLTTLTLAGAGGLWWATMGRVARAERQVRLLSLDVAEGQVRELCWQKASQRRFVSLAAQDGFRPDSWVRHCIEQEWKRRR